MSTVVQKNTFTFQVCSNICPHVTDPAIKNHLDIISRLHGKKNTARVEEARLRSQKKIDDEQFAELDAAIQEICSESLRTQIQKALSSRSFSYSSDIVDGEYDFETHTRVPFLPKTSEPRIEEVILHNGQVILQSEAVNSGNAQAPNTCEELVVSEKERCEIPSVLANDFTPSANDDDVAFEEWYFDPKSHCMRCRRS